MITGFNTDIVYGGITYHVQTEDKGLNTPLILSLIYNGGTILASKRSPYNDLLENFDEKALSERLQRQHKLICAAIRSGRIEDLKRMTMKSSAANVEIIDKTTENGVLESKLQLPNKTGFETFIIPRELRTKLPAPDKSKESEKKSLSDFDETRPNQPTILDKISEIPLETPALLAFREKTIAVDRSEEIFSAITDPFATELGRIPKPDDGLIFEVRDIVSGISSEPIIEEVKIVEEEVVLPSEAVIIVSENIKQKQTSDDKLAITLLNEMEFRSGERKTISISVHRGDENFGLVKAHVIIKILGSAFRPIIFHAKTDSNGVAVVHLQLPDFNSGRAVLLIRASYAGEETEIRRVISQG